ncbi:hypothetical protein [Clostridium sp.]|uniref:hypothetical protein n=1 Tax=Clostridium sp. TaxID=1506 RepID=UPI0026191E51|nr:hypothetical protein [Clostridium sp.]
MSVFKDNQLETCDKIITEMTKRLEEINKFMDAYGKVKVNIIDYDNELEYKELKYMLQVSTLSSKLECKRDR